MRGRVAWSLAGLLLMALIVRGQSDTNAVSITMLSPTNGQFVSGTIPITITASSTAAPIDHIDIFRDGSLIATLHPPKPPTPLTLTQIQ